jgi:tetratricopeptide (TPR) repeat protein
MSKKTTQKPVRSKAQASASTDVPAVPTSPTASQPFEWLPWAVALLAMGVYATGFSNPLVAMDDHSATVDNLAVKNFPLLTHFNLGMYAPLTWAGYAIAYHLQGPNSGENALWYHIMSATVHAINTALVYKIFRKLEITKWSAALIAVLFAVHPLQVESVSWVAGFSTPLYALFSLLTLWYYLKYTETAQKKWYWTALLMLVLGCLSKSAAVVTPLLMLLLDAWKRPDFSLKKSFGNYVPFFAVSLFFGLLTFYSRAYGDDVPLGMMQHYSAFDRFLMVCYAPLFYIGKILYPLHLNVYYSFDKVNGQFPVYYFIAPLVAASLAYLAWRLRHQAPYLWMGLAFFIANLSVMLPFSPVGSFELCADHYNYLSCIGIFFIAASALEALQKRFPVYDLLIKGLPVLVALALTGLTLRQIGYWGNTLNLMNNAIENGYYSNGKMYLWRGMEYGNRRNKADNERALDDFNKAIAMDSTLHEAYKYRGAFLGMKGEYEQSVSDLSKYLKRKPNDPEYRFNRGVSYLNLNKPKEAIADFNVTLQVAPHFYQAYRPRGNAWIMLGDTARGRADLAEFKRRSGAN